MTASHDEHDTGHETPGTPQHKGFQELDGTFFSTPPTDLSGYKNFALVVGTLEPAGAPRGTRAEVKVIARRYAPKGGSLDQLRIQVLDAARTVSYGMRLIVPSSLRMQVGEEMAKLREGQRIMVWGSLSRPVSYDGRFSNPLSRDPDAGREYRETIITVQGMSLAGDDEEDGSLVVIEGKVLTPPLICRHEEKITLEVARTTMEISWSFRARGRHSAGALEVDRTTLLVEVPTELPNANAMYRAGNIVRLEGRLDAFVERLPVEGHVTSVTRRSREVANPVAATLARLDAEWEERRATLKGQELAIAERNYARARRSLQQDRALRVRVGLVELVAGSPMTLTEAQKQRRERAARRTRAQRSEPAPATPGASREAQVLAAKAEQTEEAIAEGYAVVRDAAPATPVRRRRPRADAAEPVEAAELAETGADAPAEGNGHSHDEAPLELPVLVLDTE